MITDDHLRELVKDTPIGRIKMLAAWESLSVETQIKLLEEMKGRTRAWHRPIWLKALSSPSEYIRYLAARETRFDRDDEIVSKVMSDASPLVQSVRNILTGRSFSYEAFDSYSRERMFAVVSDDDPPPPQELAHWLEQSAENKSASEDLLYEIVFEYLANPEAFRCLHESTYDFYADERRKAGFDALWRLIQKVPNSVANCLVSRLPWRGILGDGPPNEVLTWLKTSPCIEWLLWRDDVTVIELRRDIFFSADQKYDSVKPASVSHHFYLSPEELHELFKQNSKLLDTLAIFCEFPVSGPTAEWTPVMVLALKESAWAYRSASFSIDENKLQQRFTSALAKLKELNKEEAFRLLKIYRLATSLVSWTRDVVAPNLTVIPEPLGFLADDVVSGDPWGTFIAFAKKINWRIGKFDYLLPQLDEVGHGEKQTALVLEHNVAEEAAQKEVLIGAIPPTMLPNHERRTDVFANALMVLGIVTALLTILFAIGGIIDNEYRNLGARVIAMAVSAGVIVFAGSRIRH